MTSRSHEGQPLDVDVDVDLDGDVRRLRLTRPDLRNALTQRLVHDLVVEMESAVAAGSRVVELRGERGHFCSGMDLAAAADDPGATDGALFWDLLTRLREAPLVTVAVVDGVATGGGVGLVAACDVVIASPKSIFSLPEALWGLLPCCVLPFLRERVGSAAARRMMLTTSPLTAEAAQRIGLVDEVSEHPDRTARQLALRARRVEPQTLVEAHAFDAGLPEQRTAGREVALDTLARLGDSRLVRETLTRFRDTGAYPWEGR